MQSQFNYSILCFSACLNVLVIHVSFKLLFSTHCSDIFHIKLVYYSVDTLMSTLNSFHTKVKLNLYDNQIVRLNSFHSIFA